MSEQVTERKLTIKDLNTSYFMFEVFAQACCSYERLQAPGFFSGMKNVIAKLYTDPEAVSYTHLERVFGDVRKAVDGNEDL